MASSTGWTGRLGHDNISSSASKASAPFQAIHILVLSVEHILYRQSGPPEMPTSHTDNGSILEIFQPWSASGESCPEGTIPIRRATEQDLLRASSVRRFGQKDVRRVRRDTSRNDHEPKLNYT
ncbi:hypothetical protein SAY86_008312 [Trapa natans]|uniref:Neprosin activation peptide domain-containing protein n=1 Tax=Trapa natans TaxID=22666 RepID=A0AAN7QAX1_TRANT|nr:hypothetical protein SAY86_008312 [Trapa natans]